MVPDWFRLLLDALQPYGLKGRPPQWNSRCPAHDDKMASLSINFDGGKNIGKINCHAGCSNDSVMAALGMTTADLFDPATRKKDDKPREQIHPYYDEQGELIFEVVRKRLKDGTKDIRQRHPDGAGGWSWTTTGLRKPLYRLPKIIQAIADGKTIYVCEGETDVEELESRGFTATCNPGGAGKWLAEHTATLKNADVVLIVDNDKPGYKHGFMVADSLEGVAKSVKVIQPPEAYGDARAALVGGVALDQFPDINLYETLEAYDPFWKVVEKVKELAESQGSFEDKLARLHVMADHAATVEGAESFGELSTFGSLLNKPIAAYDWIIPDLIERGDRIMLIAGEGVGKSHIMRQIVLSLAEGIHPFYKTNITPKRALFLDLENLPRVISRSSQTIVKGIKEKRPYADFKNAHILQKPDGMDILDQADRSELERVIEQTEPDLLIISPIYKFYNATGGREHVNDLIVRVVKQIDFLRSTYNFAVMMEHHAPFGNSDSNRSMRPIDSTIWLRWPDFGLTLQPDATVPGLFNLGRYRGDRDTRTGWPEKLDRTGEFGWSPA